MKCKGMLFEAGLVKVLGQGCILVAKGSVAIANIIEFLEPLLWIVLMYA